MKRSQAFIEHQNKLIEKSAAKEKEMAQRSERSIKTAKLEAEYKLNEAEDKRKESLHQAAESDEKVNSLKKELSGLRQAWGSSNSTKNTEYKALMKADHLKLEQEVSKASKAAFEEGE